MAMNAEQGLRERKKERTRQVIADAAHELFTARGFDAVTVTDVARAADVSPGTVFNYFPTKEDLFYAPMELFEARLLEAVRERPAGESAMAAFELFVIEGSERLERADVAELIARAARLIGESAALQAREREVVAQYTALLAEELADELETSLVEAATVANALMGVQRAVVEHVRAQVLAGVKGSKLAASARAEGSRGFAVLASGLAGYGVRNAK
jgi:AcrR family transcriptional regulator